MDDKEIVFHSDARFGDEPFGPGVDINISIIRHDALDPGALGMRGYLHDTANDGIYVYLYTRDNSGDSWIKVHKTVPRDTPLCDLTQELYLLVLMGFDTGETDYEKDVRLNRA